jgi:hypothetical protein
MGMELEELRLLQDELIAQSEDRQHTCDDHLSLRVRRFAGGASHHVMQCLVCGEQRGGPVAKTLAAAQLHQSTAPLFDDTIREQRLESGRALASQISKVNDEIEALRHPHFAQQRATERERVKTETAAAKAALDAAVAAVRVLPWQNRRNFLIDYLMDTHGGEFVDPAAAPVDEFSSEAQLKAWLDEWIEEDFDVTREVPGKHLVRATKVIADYIIAPKEHLIAKGFKPGPIGLEVKYLPLKGGFSPKASRFIWQAASYMDCEFTLNGVEVRLPRVLLFSNISFDGEREQLRGISGSTLSNDRAKWTALLELANHANVGNLEIYGTRAKRKGWRIAFATGVYFSSGERETGISNARLFEKERIGSF